MMQMTRRRPLGVTIIAILVAIGGIFEIIGGIALLAHYGTTGILAILVGVISLFLAWGLWTLQSWAFWWVVIVEVIHLVEAILALTQHQNVGWGDLAFPIIILLYMFLDRNVRAAFRT